MKKSALILLVAVAISTVSCVDNAVSPQVEAIRSQQVEWMKAKTAGQVAANALVTAEAAYKVASNALLLKTSEATYAALVAANADLLIKAKYAMAVASAANDVVLADAAIAMAQAGDDKAIAYLGRYKTETGLLAEAINARLNIQSALVAQELLVASNPKDITAYIAVAQKTIDGENAKIAGAKAAIAVYNASTTGTDVTAFVTEKAALDLKNRTLAIANVRLLYDISRNNLVITEQNDKVTALNTTRKTQDDSRAAKITERSNLESKPIKDDKDIAAIAVLTKEIDGLIASIKVIDDEVKALGESTKALVASNDSKTKEQGVNDALTTKNNSIIAALVVVIDKLNEKAVVFGAPLTGSIASEISKQEGIITKAEGEIKTATAQLSATTVKQALVDAQKLVVTLTAELATANVKVTAQEKIVAYWKALLDKIFTA